MYYIVYLKDWKKNVIVPKQWIKDVKLHKEKFYNNSVNSSQIFTCFYTNNPNAFDQDGFPQDTYAPDFQARFCDGSNDEGLYRVQLRAYKGEEGCFRSVTFIRKVI